MRTFEIKQDFRDEDPNRVAEVFRRDLLESNVSKLTRVEVEQFVRDRLTEAFAKPVRVPVLNPIFIQIRCTVCAGCPHFMALNEGDSPFCAYCKHATNDGHFTRDVRESMLTGLTQAYDRIPTHRPPKKSPVKSRWQRELEKPHPWECDD